MGLDPIAYCQAWRGFVPSYNANGWKTLDLEIFTGFVDGYDSATVFPLSLLVSAVVTDLGRKRGDLRPPFFLAMISLEEHKSENT